MIRLLPPAVLIVLAACSTGPGLAELERELRDGRADPAALWQDPRWHELRADARRRAQLARLLRAYPRSVVTIATAAEPGRRFEFSGRVVDADLKAVPRALVLVYHADADGRYSPEFEPGDGDRNARLFAWLVTDSQGRFLVRTVLPGTYGGAPPHFHFGITQHLDATGIRRGGVLYFEGDWPMDDEVYADARAGTAYVCPISERPEGGVRAAATIELRER